MGGSTDVRLLRENGNKTNLFVCESLILNEGCLSFVGHSLHPLVERVGPTIAIMIGQSWCLL